MQGITRELSFVIRPRKLIALLALAVALLTLLGAAGGFLLLQRPGDGIVKVATLVSLGEDANLPTWYASVTLLLCGVLLGVIGLFARNTSDPFANHWLILATLFILLSVDEVAMIHERAGWLLRWLSPAVSELGGMLRYSWILVGIPLLLILGAVMLRWFLHLPRRFKGLFGAAALIYIGGALGLEMVNAATHDAIGTRSLRYQGLTLVEELCEMTGVLVFLYGLINYICGITGAVTVRFHAQQKEV